MLFLPVAVATWDVEREAVPWIVASATLELVYFLLLTAAYQRSDLSLVYPIARGSAPVLVLVGATAAGAALGAWQALGVVLVGVGVMLVRGLGGVVDRKGIVLSLLIGATIAGYTLVDKEGIEHASTVAYLELVLAPVALATVALQVARNGSRSLRGGLGAASVVAGVLSFAAYALALAALELAPAAAVAAVRETSILFAVALGAVVLRERVDAARVGGAALVVAGVALVALGEPPDRARSGCARALAPEWRVERGQHSSSRHRGCAVLPATPNCEGVGRSRLHLHDPGEAGRVEPEARPRPERVDVREGVVRLRGVRHVLDVELSGARASRGALNPRADCGIELDETGATRDSAGRDRKRVQCRPADVRERQEAARRRRRQPTEPTPHEARHLIATNRIGGTVEAWRAPGRDPGARNPINIGMVGAGIGHVAETVRRPCNRDGDDTGDQNGTR